MLSLLTRLKAKLWIAAGAVLAVLAAVVRIKALEYQRDKARYRAEHAEAQLDWKRETEARETEIDQKWSDWERAAKEDIDVVPDIIAHPRKRRG